MRRIARSTPARVFCRLALAAGPIACLGLIGCDPGDPLEAIRQQQRAGDLAGSIEPLRELLAERPDDAEAHYLYGRALVLTQQRNLASWSLRRAMQDPDWLIPAGLQLAELSFGFGDFRQTEEVTTRILEHDPENVAALLLRARALALDKKEPKRALADAERVAELDPELLAAYEPRIMALVALDRREEAGEALAEAGRRLAEAGAGPDLLAWHCATTARLQQESGELEAARESWSGCLEKFPAYANVHSGALGFHDAQGEPDRSLEIAQAAFERAPAARSLRVDLANRLLVLGRPAEAEALLREATTSPDPRQAAAAWADLGKLRIRLGEYRAAAEAMEKALELARQAGASTPQLEFDYADVLVVAGRLERALAVAEALSVPAHRHLIRARVLQERRQPARALAEFDEGLRLWPDNAYARYYAAYAAQELGDFDRAIEEFRYSVRSDPGATDARVAGAALLLAEGRPRLAELMVLAGTGKGALLDRQGQLLLMRIRGSMGNLEPVGVALARLERIRPEWVGRTLAEAAEGAAERAGPAVALRILAEAPTADYRHPRYAAALRVYVRLAHEVGDTEAAHGELRAALAAHPESGAFQEIRGLDLELSGAPPEAVREAYDRALELEPTHALALAGLGRLALAEDPAAALALFDRAAALDPSDPDPKLQAARALVASGKPQEAAQRLDALLLAHPLAGDAALERVRLDLAEGNVSPRTLERARRAARFGGGPEALELLSRVHEERGETELASRVLERAQAIREAANPQAAGSQASETTPSSDWESDS